MKNLLISVVEDVLRKAQLEQEMYGEVQSLAMHDPSEFMRQYGKYVADEFRPFFESRTVGAQNVQINESSQRVDGCLDRSDGS